jgi:hypothetical protein
MTSQPASSEKQPPSAARETEVLACEVAIWGRDVDGRAFFQNARIQDISQRGGLLVGLQHHLAAGDVIGLQYQGTSAWARVAWTAEVVSGCLAQSAIHLLDPKCCPWLPLLQGDAPIAEAARSERRRFPRRRISLAVEITLEGGHVHSMTHTADLSACGCYIESMMPWSVGSRLTLRLWLGSHPIQTAAVVRTSDPGVGMGIEFCDMNSLDQVQLQECVAAYQEVQSSA